MLCTPSNVAETVTVVPGVIVESNVPVVSPFVRIKSVGSEFFQFTSVVMSCEPPAKNPMAVKVMVEFASGFIGTAVSTILEGAPGLTVTVAEVDGTAPKLPEIVAVQTAVTDVGATTRPPGLVTLAQVESDEDQDTFPVRSLVVPSS